VGAPLDEEEQIVVRGLEQGSEGDLGGGLDARRWGHWIWSRPLMSITGRITTTLPATVSLIRNISFDCADPYPLAVFWGEVVGHSVHPECAPGDAEVVIEPPGGPRLYFQAVPESKQRKNRVHVCLEPSDRGRDAEVDRLLALGASVLGDHRTPDGEGWVVLRDPVGNEFCVTRSAAERHPEELPPNAT
jgi:predicted enzyme related to lactoylglutathione lyase